MKRLQVLKATMQIQNHLLASRSTKLGLPWSLVSHVHVTCPPPRQELQKPNNCVLAAQHPLIACHIIRGCTTVTRATDSEAQPDVGVAATAASVAPAETEHATDASVSISRQDTNTLTEVEVSSHGAANAGAVEASAAAANSSTGGGGQTAGAEEANIELKGSIHKLWMTFLEQLWSRGYFQNSVSSDR